MRDPTACSSRSSGRLARRVSVDDFHQARAVRYARGRSSPEGYWQDAFDYERLRRHVLQPLGRGGCRVYRPKAHDVASDLLVEAPPVIAEEGAVIVIDGVFLHRVELRDNWRFSILLDVTLETSVRRMAERDGTPDDPEHPAVRRYAEAQRRYFETCDPRSRADIVIDNTDVDAPVVTRLRVKR